MTDAMRLATPVKVDLRKVRATWYWTVHYAEGGSFGSNHAGTKRAALRYATHSIRPGETFELVTNGKSEGRFTVDAAGATVKEGK